MPNNNINAESQQRIGHYLLGKTLGKGTFGKVRQAIHTITKEKVAVKVLNKNRIEDDEDRQRLLRQMEILRRIRHPNIIQLYQIMQTNTNIYLMVEYAERGQLYKLILRDERIKQQPACRIFLQIINAVEYLHRLGISHRDLKPQNILLDFDYNVKLIDFGLSNYYEEGTFLSTACGSPGYAPPQMVSGKSYNGFMTDVWSMGIILYVMVCGSLPFEDKTTRELYKKIISGDYTLPEYLSDDVKRALQSMLITDPKKRIPLSHIRYLPFFTKYTQLEPPIYGLIVGRHPIPIDLDLLTGMKKIIRDLDISRAQEDIRSNRHNHITTTYYLLQKQVLREGGKTNIDLQLYLQSSPEYQRDYGKASHQGSNRKGAVQPEKNKRSVDSIIKYQKANRSILKRKKQQQNLKTISNESVKAQKISPTRKFRVGDYTYLCRDYAKRLFRSTSKEQNRKFYSLRRTELNDKLKFKLKPRLNESTISENKLKKRQPGDIPVKLKTSGQMGDLQDMKETMGKTKETYLNKDRTAILKAGVPLEAKVWHAYFKSTLQPKIVSVNKNAKTSMKDRQKQEIIKQNIRQIRECFTKLPEFRTELCTEPKSNSKDKYTPQIHTARN